MSNILLLPLTQRTSRSNELYELELCYKLIPVYVISFQLNHKNVYKLVLRRISTSKQSFIGFTYISQKIQIIKLVNR